MKVLTVTLLVLVAVASSKNIKDVTDLENLTAYDYHNKVGIRLAKEIREAEAQQEASRITGGSPAHLGQLPYQIGLVIDLVETSELSVCGGVILNNWRAVTAAHCWQDGANQAWRFTVVAGSVALFSGGQRHQTSNVVMHENWNSDLIRDDIAMIYLNSPFIFSNTVSSVALPSGNELNMDYVGWTATASGFGRTGDGPSEGITFNQILSHVDLPVITNAECASTYPQNVVAGNICISGANGRSTCSGDSGGPLVVTNNGRRILIGITSFGSIFGCSLGFPVAFVRVTSYITWINSRL